MSTEALPAGSVHIMKSFWVRERFDRRGRGVLADGVLRFPRPVPSDARSSEPGFRISKRGGRRTFRFKVIETYLAPLHMATLKEFARRFHGQGQRELLLCALQEYRKGDDHPWIELDDKELASLKERMPDPESRISERMELQTCTQLLSRETGC